MATGNSAVRYGNVQETLFVDEDGPKTKTRRSRPPPEDSSPEFKSLIETVNKRQERRRSKKTIAASAFDRARQEVGEMIETGEWDGCQARHLVALYDKMHTKVYGIAPSELGPQERYRAVLMVAGLVKREFGDDFVAAVEYMRWVWTREIGREKWRRENGREGRRILVHQMFTPSFLLTDYRLSLARKAGKT